MLLDGVDEHMKRTIEREPLSVGLDAKDARGHVISTWKFAPSLIQCPRLWKDMSAMQDDQSGPSDKNFNMHGAAYDCDHEYVLQGRKVELQILRECRNFLLQSPAIGQENN